MQTDAIRVSPQQIDPLSWITRPLVALSFALVALVYGLVSVAVSLPDSRLPLLDLLGVLLVTGACIWVQFVTGPLKPPLGAGRVSVALALAIAGLVASTIATSTSAVGVQLWWAPVGLGIVLATCGPYSSAASIAVYGGILAAATGVATASALLGRGQPWSDVTTVVIGCTPVVIATVATAAFCFQVARQSQRLLARAGVPLDADEAVRAAAARRAEIGTLARLGSRVAPFLDGIADAGVVTHVDRALAGQLARRLRSDLVSQANRTWLDSLALNGRIYVVDPDRRADTMNAAQRAAVRGLVLSVLRDPVTDSGSLFIELRGQDDGSTAVALSLDIDLPEGRRLMMLAPYYVALKTTVHDISWDPMLDLLRFRLPPGRRR